MKYIDMHAHMVSRTTDDYRQMALTGCLAVTEPAFWAGYDRRSADVFADYFDHLTTFEPARAAEYDDWYEGRGVFVAISPWNFPVNLTYNGQQTINDPAAASASVPTLSEWSTATLALLMPALVLADELDTPRQRLRP